MAFRLDMSKFKKVNADKDCATLKHSDGHEIKISLKSLSPKMRSEIAALPLHKAEGGEIKEQEVEKPKEMAADQASQPAATPDPILERKRQLYNIEVSLKNPSPMDPMGIGQGVDSTQMMFDKSGTEPSQFDAQAWQRAESQFASEVAAKQQQSQATQQRAIAENQARLQAGLSPIPVPEASPTDTSRTPTGTIAPTSTSPAAAPSPLPGQTLEDDEAKLMKKGVEEQKQGLKLEAEAAAKQGQMEAEAAQTSMKAQQEILDDFKQRNDSLQSEYNSVLKDIKDGHIDTHRFWANKSGVGKVSTIVGLIAGGLGQAAGGPENGALKIINNEIDRDIEAQKANLNMKGNVLNALTNQMGNLRQATDMLKTIKLGIASDEMKKAAALAKDPMAKARLLQASGELDMKVAPQLAKMAAQQTVSKLMKVVNNDPSKAPLLFDAVRKIDPKQAQDLQERYIPGIGFALTGKDATDLKEIKTGVDTAKAGINELFKIMNTPFKSLSLEQRAKADTIRQTLVGALRLPITGPGAMNEGERKMLENIIANPTSIFSFDSVNKAKLKALGSSLDQKFAEAAKVRGITVPGKEQQLSAQQQSYAKWARANPTNPKSKLILEKLGLE